MKPRRYLSLFIAGVVAAMAVFAVQSPAGASATRPFPIGNAAATLCLAVSGASVSNGAPIVQDPCDLTDSSQLWTAVSLGGERYHYQNLNSGQCLDAQAFHPVNGTPIVQWPCSGISNETWDTGGPVPDLVALRSLIAGTSTHCLDTPGNAQTIGLSLQLYVCNGSVAQKWFVFGP